MFGSLLSGLLVRTPGTWAGQTHVDGEVVLQRTNASHALLVGTEAQPRARFDVGLYASAALWAVWGQTERVGELGDTVVEPASKSPGPAGALRFGFEHKALPVAAEVAFATQLPQARLSESDSLDVRLCPDGPERCRTVPGFAVLSVRASLQLSRHSSLSLAIENLLDAAYRTHASGAYAPGRNIVIAARAQL